MPACAQPFTYGMLALILSFPHLTLSLSLFQDRFFPPKLRYPPARPPSHLLLPLPARPSLTDVEPLHQAHHWGRGGDEGGDHGLQIKHRTRWVMNRVGQKHGKQVLRIIGIKFRLLTFKFVVIPLGKEIGAAYLRQVRQLYRSCQKKEAIGQLMQS